MYSKLFSFSPWKDIFPQCRFLIYISHIYCYMQLARIFIRKISHLKNTLKFASKKSVCKSSCKNLHASLLCGFYVEIRHIARNLGACKSCNARGLYCRWAVSRYKQNMHSKSYISLYKLYKEKKTSKKKNNNNNNDNNKTMPRLTGIQQEGVLHAHVCMRWATIAWAHQIWWREIKNSCNVTVLSKAILLVFRISYFDKTRTFSKQDFSAVGFLDLLKTLKTQGQKSLFPY